MKKFTYTKGLLALLCSAVLSLVAQGARAQDPAPSVDEPTTSEAPATAEEKVPAPSADVQKDKAADSAKKTTQRNSSGGAVNLSTTITGNQEQPQVLYIVPWKQTTSGAIDRQPLESNFSDVFDHVERDEHKREVQYLDALTKSESAGDK